MNDILYPEEFKIEAIRQVTKLSSVTIGTARRTAGNVPTWHGASASNHERPGPIASYRESGQ